MKKYLSIIIDVLIFGLFYIENKRLKEKQEALKIDLEEKHLSISNL